MGPLTDRPVGQFVHAVFGEDFEEELRPKDTGVQMTVVGSEGPVSHRYTLSEYREAIASIVTTRQAAGDCNLHLLRGENLTTVADLTDGAHLSVAGAANFAAGLNGLIGPPWGDFNADAAWDAADWLLFESCISGPGMTPPAGACDDGDHDCDADVDLHEVAELQLRMLP